MTSMTKDGISGPFAIHPDAATLPEWTTLGVECISLLVVFLAFWAWRKDTLRVVQISTLMLAGWAGESIAMLWYDYYAYAPDWQLWIGHVPLAVVGVWPVVILTSYDVVKAIAPKESKPTTIALFTALMVIFDAAFIEPVAVRMGLWAWRNGTYFHVPILGFAGWGFLGFAAVMTFEEAKLKKLAGFDSSPRIRNSITRAPLLMVLLCHLLLAPCVFAAIYSDISIPLSFEGYSWGTFVMGLVIGLVGFKLGSHCPLKFFDFWLLIAGSSVFFASIYAFWLEPFVWSLATWPTLFWGLGIVPYKKAT